VVSTGRLYGQVMDIVMFPINTVI